MRVVSSESCSASRAVEVTGSEPAAMLFRLVLLSLILAVVVSFRTGFGRLPALVSSSSLLRDGGEVASTASSATGASSIKARLAADMKEAMKAKQKERLGAIRAVQTAIKQKEVDERIEVNDDVAISIMSSLIKQRKESIKSYLDGGRQDLVDVEQAEVDVIYAYMPQQLSEAEITSLVVKTISDLKATTVKDMGKIMGVLRPQLAGKADMAALGDIIKKMLSGGAVADKK
jgi:uncharacterized protein